MMELAFSIQPVGDVEQKLDTLLTLGVRNIGVGELDPIDYYNRDQANQLAIDTLARQIKKRKMNVVTVHGVGGFVSPDRDRQGRALAHLEREVDRAAAWSCPRVVFHHRQASMPWSKTEMADWTVAITQAGLETYDKLYHQTLADLCEHAACQGVTVYLEAMGPPFSYGQCVEQILPTLKAVNHRNLGVCVDSGHLHLSGHDPARQIRLTQGFPLTLHLNDNLGPLPPGYDIYDSDLHLVPGLGTIDWVQVILALSSVGYSGPYFFEDARYPGSSYGESVKLTLSHWRIFESLAQELAPRWV